MNIRKTLLTLLCTSVVMSHAMAATKTWTATSASNYTISTNWNPTGTPGTSDDIVNATNGTGATILTSSAMAASLSTGNTTGTWVIGTSSANSNLGALSFTLSGTLSKNGAGTTLTFRNQATGTSSLALSVDAIAVNGGTLNLGSTTAAEALSNITANTTSVASGAVLNISVANATANSFSLGDLTNNGTIRLVERSAGGSTTAVATVSSLSGSDVAAVIEAHDASSRQASLIIDNGVNTGTSTYAGILRNGANASSSLQVTKSGAGTQILSGANTYSGTTAVNAGTLLINGTHVGAGNYTVASGAILGGIGTITPAGANAISIASSGTLAPGSNGIGVLTIDSGSSSATSILSIQSGAGLKFELNSSGPGNFQSDKISLINGATGDIAFNDNVINFTDLSSGNLAHGQYLLFSSDVANAYTGLGFSTGNVINDGLFIGTGLGAYSTTLNLVGNNIYLTVVPEPQTWLLISLGLGLVLFRKRKATI